MAGERDLSMELCSVPNPTREREFVGKEQGAGLWVESY